MNDAAIQTNASAAPRTGCFCCPAMPGATFLAAARRTAAAKGRTASTAKARARRRPAPAGPRRIDVHHHIAPAVYVKSVGAQRAFAATWTPALALEEMDRSGTATAITCIYAGSELGEHPDARRIARECNEYAAGMGRDHPGRFGSFAALPLPDVEGSLAEIAYALDVLGADGIYMNTSYGERWMGDPHFAPMWEELNRRKATVFIHPHAPELTANLLPGIPGPVIEYATDTTRCIASLVFSGTATRSPGVNFIFCHAGGTMPFLVERFTRLARRADFAERLPRGVLHELKRFYYECAQAAHPMALPSLAKLVAVSRILFGTDFPYRSTREIAAGLARCGFSDRELKAIHRGNAARLFPRFA